MTIGHAVIHKQTKCTKYASHTELLQYTYYKDLIYTTKHKKFINKI